MLPTVAAAEIGRDHVHRIFGQPKRLSQLTAHTEWILTARPNRELAVGPLGQRDSWLQRRMLHISNRVGRAERFRCLGNFRRKWIGLHAATRLLTKIIV